MPTRPLLHSVVRNFEDAWWLVNILGKPPCFIVGMYDPDFNSPEFEGIKSFTGLNNFRLSVVPVSAGFWVRRSLKWGDFSVFRHRRALFRPKTGMALPKE